jgi:hypothetical protein
MASFEDHVKGHRAQMGDTYDYLQLIGKMPALQIKQMILADINKIKQNFKIAAGVNITHASRNAAADAKIFELNVQLEAIEIMIKKEKEKEKIIEKNMDPIILQIPNNKTHQMDYTRPITIGIILLALIGGILIWKLK